jgi:hypothetical protein
MDLTPVSRAELQGRRAAKIEADRQHFIKQTIEIIYKYALHAADTRETSSYKYLISSQRLPKIIKHGINGMPSIKAGIRDDKQATMLFDNSNEIVEELRKLFPDCTVKYTTQIQDTLGNLYEDSTLTEDNIRYLRINMKNCQEVILIDWSDQIPS